MVYEKYGWYTSKLQTNQYLYRVNKNYITMKQLSLFAIFAITSAIAMAQDIEQVKTFAYIGQTAKAKEAVDKYLAIEKNTKKADGWFYKGYVYNQASKDSSKTLAESAALKAEAFEALKKYRELDPKNVLLNEQNNSPLFDIYVGYATELGIKAYNNKDLPTAFEYFKKGVEVHDYIYAGNLVGNNGFKFTALDTTLTLYSAIAATEAKKPDDAAIFYKKLTDANLSDAQYLDAYQILADYYKNKKDTASFTEILEKGKKLYPKNNEYWIALEIEAAVDGVAKPAVFAKYEELMAKHPENYTIPYNYGVELYHYIYSDQMKNANSNEYKAKLAEVMKKALAVKQTSEANFLLANFLYNNSIDISEEGRKLHGPKPDDIKKKKALEAESTKSMNESISYAESVVSMFASIAKPKPSEKINYRQSLNILKNIYELKKDTAKAASYDKLIKEAQ